MKLNNKKGISLIVIAITILVSLILVPIAVAATGNAIENANITEYIDNLNLIKDSVESYYITNGEFPIENLNIDGNRNYYTQGEIISLIELNNTSNKDTFIYDMRQNEDYLDDDSLGEFYIVDLSKLGVEKTEIGNKVRSNLDVFAFSYPSMNIYYLEGMKLKNDVYFSLNKRLTYISNVSGKKDDESVSQPIKTDVFDGITITRSNAKWTNNLNLSIISDDIANVSVRISGSNTWHNLKSNVNSIGKISEFNSKNLLVSNFSSNEVSNFSILSSNERYIEIMNNNTQGKIKIDLTNYDDKSPQILSYMVNNNSEMSIITFGLEDYDSGIREIRYEYLTKFDNDKNIVDYTNSTIDENYMLTKAKKIRALGSKELSIKVPTNINKIRVYVIDNAGNYIGQDMVVKEADDYVLINSSVNYFTSDGVNLSLNVSGNYNRIEASISSKDNLATEIKQQVTDLNNVQFTGLSNVDTVYLKVKAISNDAGKEVETVKNFTYNLKGNYPYIPNGFYYVGGSKESGFIISDNSNDSYKGDSFEVASGLVGNQFVWIPVEIESSSIQNLKSKWYRTAFETGNNYDKTSLRVSLDQEYTEPLNFNGITATNDERKLYNNVLSSIQKYHGFYIGRYETGAVNINTPRTVSNANTENILGIKKDLYVYNCVPFGNGMTDFSKGATKLANNMYNTNYVGSNLIFGIEWDQVMKFIDANASNSVSWGNYSDSIGNANENSGMSNANFKTGRNPNWVSKNIYDLAGNVSEWTMEAYSNGSRTTRGGNLQVQGGSNAAAVRLAYEPSTVSNLIGFRVCLYFK